jgi:hypothetical protein
MRYLFQLASVLVFFTGLAPAQLLGPAGLPGREQKKAKVHREGVEWMWQYSPPPADGRENELLQDPKFVPFLQAYLTAPQAFWGPQDSPRRSLADTAFDFLAVPGQVIADSDRYITVTGCVFHFCSNRGLLWVDLNAKDPLVIFAAIDWTTEDRTPDDPASTYTLWVFTNQVLTPQSADKSRIPPALVKAIARWTAKPAAGSKHLQNITTAVLVDPDGTPHQMAADALGVTSTEKKGKQE